MIYTQVTNISVYVNQRRQRESESYVSEPQSENTARAGRACCEDYPDLISHHNERPARDRPADRPEPQTDPAPEEEPSKQGPRP